MKRFGFSERRPLQKYAAKRSALGSCLVIWTDGAVMLINHALAGPGEEVQDQLSK